MIIGIAGAKRSGKDTTASVLRLRWGYEVEAFAEDLRQEVLRTWPRLLRFLHFVEKQHPGVCICSTQGEAACIRDMVYVRKPAGVREILQEHGTELRRNDDPEYWEKSWAKRVDGRPLIVVPDVRFENEAQAILKRGGQLWVVERPGYGENGDSHVSEQFWKRWTRWDARLQNDGTVDDLYRQVDEIVGRLRRATA